MQPRLPSSLLILGSWAGLLVATSCVRKHFFQPDARPDSALAQPLPTSADSVRGATAGRQYARHSRLYKALVGQHHRPIWAAAVTVPVLRLPLARPGGLTSGKVGGGFNSTSLTLNPHDGEALVLRTVDKDPIRATPKVLRGTFLVNALRDNVSATNPYAALVVPPLAQAVGVPRATPRLYYVRPDDPAFRSDSLRLFRGQLAFLEEKFAVESGPVARGPRTVWSSTEAFEAAFKSPARQLNQTALLQARLLDGWLGDWDRHPGQWNWAVSSPSASGVRQLSPLPKDRDMVFYRLDDGLLGWLVGHLAQRHWTSFGPRYPKAANLLSSGHYLDTRGLNQLALAQFTAAAQAMQRQLPDSLIARAVHRLPPAAFALEGPATIAALQARRTELPALAKAFYLQLARRPVVGGTALAERFEVHRYQDSTVVAVFSAQPTAASSPSRIYQRAFFPAETKLIQLEGLGGDDAFIIEQHGAKTSRQPRIRIFGGPGTDKLTGHSSPGIQFHEGGAPAKRAYDKLPEE
ncbi:hypothetical protein [Hymenobacter sedentarius]|uniref:hypothetical protein n=1 Tax=Hymenobacter sedentarius TaxID=1411621 RepID=UPI0012FE4C3B|nr:hypothetical protein [Hymenobacter sedentarius]